ncbi:tape measure protein [Pseudomonas sp. PHC1]|uniref:tape measure protein n=1 Tax=Pseudomonas sp. PHC1 TaxID=3384759 RepID=UPI00396F5D32
MSIQEEIARLTGKLVFEVSSAPLTKFLGMLKTAETAMARVGKEAQQLQAQLNKTFGVSGKGLGSERIKLNADIRRSLDKELVTETKLSKLRRQQFTTQLAEQRLISAGTRQEGLLQSNALKEQVARAVLQAKQHKAQQEALKVELGRAKVQASAEQSQLRQARLADVLQKRQARTVELQRKAAAHQTALQRAEAALQNARASGIRQAERYEASKAAAAVREARAAVKHDQSNQRFAFQAERFAAWKARQDAPKEMGFGGLAVGFSAASAAVYSLVKGIGYLNERIQQRQESASTAEQFNTALQSAGGKNPANQKFARDQFIDISNRYGQEVSVETGKSFALFIQGQLALGKTLTQATKMFEDQSATLLAAGADKEQAKRAAYQLNQIRAKGKPEGSDVNDLFDAVGGVVAASIRQAAATRLNFKGKVEEQAGWFKQSVTDGKIKAADFDQGMTNFLNGNRDLLARQMNSIAANQQRAENQAYLNDNAANTNSELKAVILDRIKAENELNTAMQPLKNTLMEFDQGLTKFNTSLIRMLIGHDANGNSTPNAMQKDPNALPGTVGAALGPRLKPASPNAQADLDERAKPGLLNGLRRLFTGESVASDQAKADENRERWAGSINPVELMNFDVFRIGSPDLGKDPENQADGSLRQFRYQPITSSDVMQAANEKVRSGQFVQPAYIAPGDYTNTASGKSHNGNIDQSTHTDIKVDVTVNALDPNGNALGEAVGEAVGKKVDDRMRQILQEARAQQKEIE